MNKRALEEVQIIKMKSRTRWKKLRGTILVKLGMTGWLMLCLGTAFPHTSLVHAQAPFNADVGPGDWPQLGGTPHRNNSTLGINIPTEWDVKSRKNIKWQAPLGSETFGNIVVANGNVYVGTNNGAAYLKRYPNTVDLGVLLCFSESDGKFLWQHSSEKLPTGRVHDWPHQGICSAPVVEGDRLWFVSNRGEVLCLDAHGFRDGENDGPFASEKIVKSGGEGSELHESDIIWKFDMMKELGVQQHNMATCAPTIWGDVLFICTSNGVGDHHGQVSAPDAPSFMAMDKHSGKVLWTDNSPGENILHGQWSCPVVGILGGVPQVLFGGGDGWLYSFRADRWNEEKPELLWKFDGNPKESIYKLSGATRNSIVAIPVIYDGLVYLEMGEDPEHGEGPGHLWCIDPTRRGDVSPELVLQANGQAAPVRRRQAFVRWEPQIFSTIPEKKAWEGIEEGKVSEAVQMQFKQAGVMLPDSATVSVLSKGKEWKIDKEWIIDVNDAEEKKRFKLERRYSYSKDGNLYYLWAAGVSSEKLVLNPNSAVVWHYDYFDQNGNGKPDFEETMHRTVGSPTIKNNLLFIADFSGLVHCLNAKTGQVHWICDQLAACWTTPLIVGESVYVTDEDGDVAIFALSTDPNRSVKKTGVGSDAIYEPLNQFNIGSAIYTMPVVANNVLFIASRNRLFAIAKE